MLHARVEEGVEATAPRRGVRQGHDDAEVRAAGRHRIQDRVVRRIDEDLADTPEAAHALDVGNHRHPLEAMRPAKPESLGDDRRAAVGGDRQRSAQGQATGVRIERLDAEHAAARHDEVGDARLLAEVDGQRADAVDEDRVEGLARDRHRVLAVRPPRSDRPVRPDEGLAVGRGDPHALQGAGDGIDRLQRAEPIQQTRGFRAQVLSADLRSRKPRAIEERDGESVLGHENGRRRARGAGADDDDVGRHDRTATRRPSTGYSRIVSRRAPAFSASARSSSREYERRTESGPS